jgi:hypothetical protein
MHSAHSKSKARAATYDREEKHEQERVLPSGALVGAAVGRVPAATTGEDARGSSTCQHRGWAGGMVTNSSCTQSGLAASETRPAKGNLSLPGNQHRSCSRSTHRTAPAANASSATARGRRQRGTAMAPHRLPDLRRVLRAKAIFHPERRG